MSQVIVQNPVITIDTESNALNQVQIEIMNPQIVCEFKGVGLQGPPGIAGGSQFTYTAGENISALKGCYYDSDTDKVLKASNLENEQCVKFVGVSTQSGTADTNIVLQRAGILEDALWNWSTDGDSSIYLSTDGTLTQTAPTTGTRLKIGFALSATKIFIGVSETVILT